VNKKNYLTLSKCAKYVSHTLSSWDVMAKEKDLLPPHMQTLTTKRAVHQRLLCAMKRVLPLRGSDEK
jgi:hypothetical protein